MFSCSVLTTDVEDAVGEESEASALAVHDVTEGSVELGLLSVRLAVQLQPSPAQDVKVVSESWRGPAGVVLSHTSLVSSQVGGTEGQPFSAAQPGRSLEREREAQ